MLTGDFSNWVNSSGKQITIYDPATLRTDASGKLVRDPFPGNKIPQNRFDPLAAQLIQVYQGGPAKLPAPNNGAAPGTVGYVQNNYLITQGSTSSPWNKFSVKVDYIFLRRTGSPVIMATTRKRIRQVRPDPPPSQATTRTSNTRLIRATYFEEAGLTLLVLRY